MQRTRWVKNTETTIILYWNTCVWWAVFCARRENWITFKVINGVTLNHESSGLVFIHMRTYTLQAAAHDTNNTRVTTNSPPLQMSTDPKSLQTPISLSVTLSHAHTHTHKLVLHQLGPLAWGSPQWNFHAAIWRSIGDRDLLSGLHVPLEKTRKPEHIGFCKSEEERRGEETDASVDDGNLSKNKKYLYIYECVCVSMFVLCMLVRYSCQSSGWAGTVAKQGKCWPLFFVVVLWRKWRKRSSEALNWPWTLEKTTPPVRGKVSVVGGQRTLTDTVFAVMQHLLFGVVRDCVYSFTFRSELNRFCALSNRSNRREDTECAYIHSHAKN